MSPRATVAAGLALALAVALPAAGGAGAQSASDAAPAERPAPLWVPDPLSDEEQAALDGARFDVVAAPVVDSAAAGDPARVAVAHWLANGARAAGLPGELPVMAALVESGLRNLPYGHADSVGLFQMRTSVWDHGVYAGYLSRPELQLRWFVAQAIAVRDARRAAGDATFGDDPETWGAWAADVERPYEPYRGRYQPRLDEARALLALPAPAIAPFELGPAVGEAAAPSADPLADALAASVLASPSITLDERARGDLQAGIIDPRLSAVLLEAAARTAIGVTVLQTGHSYYTVHGTVSNHSSGRGVDIGTVAGAPVDAGNAAARELALALGRLPQALRPTEIGTPWPIDAPGYFTDGDHRDHLHVAFDDSPAPPLVLTAVPAVARRSSPPAEPRFDVRPPAPPPADRGEPRFDVDP